MTKAKNTTQLRAKRKKKLTRNIQCKDMARDWFGERPMPSVPATLPIPKQRRKKWDCETVVVSRRYCFCFLFPSSSSGSISAEFIRNKFCILRLIRSVFAMGPISSGCLNYIQ
mmetsp:Transcript_6291/g.14198  ORF Transcript_6291/g.14198 Transcript_6291/m.14198 type:complete len:113 (+) Transcript_6291:1329-1667(+)